MNILLTYKYTIYALITMARVGLSQNCGNQESVKKIENVKEIEER